MNCSPLVLAMMIIINFPPTCSPGSLAERHRAPPPGLGNSSRASLISDIPRVWRLNTLMRIKSLRFHYLSPFSLHNSGFCVCSFTPPRCVLMGGGFILLYFWQGVIWLWPSCYQCVSSFVRSRFLLTFLANLRWKKRMNPFKGLEMQKFLF